MSALVTEAHRAITESVCELLDSEEMVGPSPAERAAQIIADSEAQALSSLAMVTAELADRNVSLRLERDQLTDALDMMRDEFMRIIACPGCNAEIGDLANRAQLELIQRVPVIVQRDRAEDELLAVKMELDQVACARTDGILRESDLQCALNMEREKVKRLTTALKDAISTYDPHRKETLVTAERQEAWIAALKGGAK